MPKLDPEVEVEVFDDGKWRRGFAYFHQHLDDGWWYSVRLHWPLTHTRLLCVRYPDQVRQPERE